MCCHLETMLITTLHGLSLNYPLLCDEFGEPNLVFWLKITRLIKIASKYLIMLHYNIGGKRGLLIARICLKQQYVSGLFSTVHVASFFFINKKKHFTAFHISHIHRAFSK